MNIYELLGKHQIEYERHDHPPVFTVEDVKRLIPDLPGAKTKNLFICDNRGKRHFLVITKDDKRLDMKKLPQAFGTGRLRFASPKRLKKYLGIEPGSVSLIAVVNDTEKQVEVIMDSDIWAGEFFQFHPLVNTSTLVMSRKNVQRLLDATGHTVKVLGVPGGNAK
jgi:Ala-tRNA(Pro) deacylase